MPDLVETITAVLAHHQWSIITHRCRCEDPATRGEWPAHASAAVAAEIRSLIPSVAFKASGVTDVAAFREAAAKLDAGFQPGGGNVTYAVSRLLREAASVLEGCTPDELATRAQRGWASPGKAGRA